MAVKIPRVRTRRMAVANASSTRTPNRWRSTASWTKACTARMPVKVSSTYTPTSATRSWLSRDKARTRRPSKTIGATTIGTTSNTNPVSLALVTSSMIRPPTSSSKLRRAIDTEEPTTTCTRVVSVDSRDSTSPVRRVSKKPGLRVRT